MEFQKGQKPKDAPIAHKNTRRESHRQIIIKSQIGRNDRGHGLLRRIGLGIGGLALDLLCGPGTIVASRVRAKERSLPQIRASPAQPSQRAPRSEQWAARLGPDAGAAGREGGNRGALGSRLEACRRRQEFQHRRRTREGFGGAKMDLAGREP